ncbi:MAG: response regulator, partial [Rariglobus sp.]
MKSVQKSLVPDVDRGRQAQDSAPALTVLMVGDEARSRRLLAFGLVDETDVVTCAESLAALDSLPATAGFGVALLDWEMKSASAGPLLERLRELDPEIPVVATVADELAARAAQKKGVNRCLTMPFSTEDLKALLKSNARAPRAVAAVKPAMREMEPVEDASEPEVVSPVAFGSQSPRMR